MVPRVWSGREEGFYYSLSRWTDLPAAKWDWFHERLKNGSMLGIHPVTGMPHLWSLRPEDTLGLVFWTRDGRNLVKHADLLEPYQKKIHFTLTGWSEVETKAPTIEQGLRILGEMVEAFGAEHIVWRFSPIPTLFEVPERFKRIADGVQKLGIQTVYLSFLQNNDLMRDTRSNFERESVLRCLAEDAPEMTLLLCNEDRSSWLPPRANIRRGICESGQAFNPEPQTEGCGCALAVDPFSINESCCFGCKYCLDPETPVLFADYVWRPLKEVREGDLLLGFDETAGESGRRGRRYRKSLVKGVHHLERPCLRLTLANGKEVITSEDHLWLVGSSGRSWLPAKKLSLSHHLLDVGPVSEAFEMDADFKAGYLTGMSLGDGTFRFPEPGVKQQVYWRVALSDPEALQRTQAFLGTFGVDLPIRPFDGGALAKKESQKVETRAVENLAKIRDLICTERPSRNYKRGFLSGMFDAEGSYNKNLRIHQTQPNGLLQRCLAYSTELGIPLILEEKAVRVSGRLRNRIQFFSETRPSLQRKLDFLIGKELDVKPVAILKIEHLGVRKVIDIETSTSTFMAAGLATHNCYAADRELSQKKRNTTKGLPVIR